MTPLQALVLIGLAAVPSQASSDEAPAVNAHVHVSAALIDAVVRRPVQRLEPVEEEILGTMYCGIGQTCAEVRAELVPDPARGTVELVMRGKTITQTVGRRDTCLATVLAPVETCIPFEVRKRISIDSKQLSAGQTCPLAWANSEVLDIYVTRGPCLLGYLAGRAQACSDKEDSEAIVAARAQCRLAKQLDEDVRPQLSRAANALGDALNWARRRGLNPRPPEWSTTAEGIDVKIRVPVDDRATPAPPPSASKSADLVAGVHSSLLDELARATFGDKTYTVFQLGDLVRDVSSRLFRERNGIANLPDTEKLRRLYKELGLEPITLVFASEPVTITCADQGVTVVLHFASLKSGDRSYPALDLKVSYRVEKTKDGFTATRQAPVQILRAKESAVEPDLLLRTRLQLSFNLLFAERLVLGDVALPASSSGARPGKLVPLETQIRNGWLQLAWVLRAEK